MLGHLELEAGVSDKEELKANNWAKNNLIPVEAFHNFVQKGDFSKNVILNFSQATHISPSIIVGRLQKEGYIKLIN